MGKEIEIKLAAPDAAALEAVGADARVEAARTGTWQEIRMVTEYLDTPDRAIAARKWTLRRRMENGEAVYTIKTPGDGYARGEWESRKESLHEAVRELVRLGAPGELAELAARGVSRTCGVEFLRRTAELTLRALSGRRDAARRGAAAAILRGGAGAGVWRGRADAGLRGVFAGAPCAARGTEKQVRSCVGIGGLDLCFPGFPDTIRSKYSAPGRTAMRWEYES